jgi:hypothetical protein
VSRPLGRSLARRDPRALLASMLRGSIAIVLALLASELLLRWRWKRPTSEAPPPRADGVVEFSRPPWVPTAYGWKNEPHRETHAVVGTERRLVRYFTDERGHRARGIDDRPDAERPTILFAGESVTLGMGIAYEESFPTLVGAELGVQAVNLAVVGYATDQAFLNLREELPNFPHTVAVVTIVMPEQLERTVDSNRPRLILDPDGHLVLVPEAPAFVRDSPLRMLTRRLWPAPGRAAIDVTRAVLVETADYVRSHGAAPLFVFTRCGRGCLPSQGESEPWIVRELLSDLPYVRVDVGEDGTIPGDAHPNALGAQRIATAVAHALRPVLASH